MITYFIFALGVCVSGIVLKVNDVSFGSQIMWMGTALAWAPNFMRMFGYHE